MLNCKQASLLASRAMDEKLPYWENSMLKMHLLLCRSCANFTQQLVFLREASRRYRNSHDLRLTEEAKKRIANALKNHSISEQP